MSPCSEAQDNLIHLPYTAVRSGKHLPVIFHHGEAEGGRRIP